MGRHTEQMEFAKSLVKLKEREEVIEKTIDNFIDGMKLEAGLLNVMKNERCSRISERGTFSNTFKKAAADVAYDLKEIKYAISNLQEGNGIDVGGLKEKLFGLANKIREFKTLDSRMETLTNEEIQLDHDLNAFSLALAKYENRNHRRTTSIADSKEYSRRIDHSKEEMLENRQNYSDIRDFDALVAKTGHTQNWSPADHALFVKMRNKCHSVPVIVAAIRNRCPDLSVESIVNHEAWYKIYLDLREKQRRSIKEWRTKKELEKREKATNSGNCQDAARDPVCGNSGAEMIDVNFMCDDSIAEHDKNQISRAVISKKSSKKSASSIEGSGDASESNKKELVKRWRIEREIARSIESEHQKARLESRKAWQEKRRLARAMELEATLAAACRQRKIGNNENNETGSTTSTSVPSESNEKETVAKARTAALIKSFRRQDGEYLKRRKAVVMEAKKLARRSSDVVRREEETITRRVRYRAVNDHRSTLLKPTKGWLEKCKREEVRASIPHNVTSYVKDIPKLATRHWRNEESV